MLTAKNDLKLIMQGGVLCAAFSFLWLLIPILGVFTLYISMVPIFYVGLCLGIRAYALSLSIPLFGYISFFGISGLVNFAIMLFAPSMALLYWHFLKIKNSYAYSTTDILHLLTSRFLSLATLGFCYIKFVNTEAFRPLRDDLHKQIEMASKLFSAPTSPEKIIEVFPGFMAFIWLLMIWFNFQMAYNMALKTHKAMRTPTIKSNRTLKPVWDIIFVGSLWLILINNLLAGPVMLRIFAITCFWISAFPLLIDGLEIAKLITKAHKVPRASVILSVVITFLLVWPLIFVVVLGLVEPWYGLKQKYLSKLN